MDTEVFNFKSLEFANNILHDMEDKEHVTKYFLRSEKIRKKKLFYKKGNYQKD